MKRPNNLHLTIPKPCLQSWEEMSQADNGKFCASCNKPVIDFSNFTDQQLKDFFNKATERICGRFTCNQIDRTLNFSENKQHRYFIPQLLVSATLTIGFASQTEAKEINVLTIQVQSESKSQTESEQNIIPVTDGDSLSCITGKIIDYNSHEPLPFASILIKGTKHEAQSDIDGNFKIFVADTLTGKEITLVITFVGYEKKEMQIQIQSLPLTADIRLANSDMHVLGMAVTGSYYIDGTGKKTFWQKLFGKKQKKQECK
ncbi:MAG TPA: carboxypeptidase-like regulatory domain-containing protein [Bacteroidia bacterium]|nr:carboxypeptidase-like regulatory domain-containing protein [Bacteroidia bacterium]